MCRLLCEAGCWGCGESRWTGFLIAGCQCPPEPGRRRGCQAWVYSRHPINIRFFLSSQQIAPLLSSHPHPDLSGPQPREATHPPAGLLPCLHFRLRNELGSRASSPHQWPPHACGPAGACLVPSLPLTVPESLLPLCSQSAQGFHLQLSGWSSQPGPGMMRGCQQTAPGISEQSLGEALGRPQALPLY